MPRPLALALTLAFISVLLWRDFRTRPRSSAALWLPVIWFFLVGSKYFSQWLAVWGFPIGEASEEDGSPLDALVFAALILVGSFVLRRRKFSVTWFVRRNQWLTVFLVYSLLAVGWSDFPFVAFKRWFKELGHPIMALIILTDSAPKDAFRTVLRRSAYFLVAPSVLLIKYYPEIGRGFDAWSGAATNNGIANSKNDLGYVLALLGLFFSWNFLSLWRIERSGERRFEIGLTIVFMSMILWLLSMSQSSTSLVCTVIGVGTMAVVSTRLVNKRFIGTYVVVGLLTLGVAESAFGLYSKVVEDVLGKDTTLTDRVFVWQDAIALVENPAFGAGFESFWLGPRLEAMWKKWWWHPIQAHNGFIETYLNLGWVGIGMLVSLIIATFRKARSEMLRDLDFGRFRLGALVAIVVYNFTEATFKALHPLWTLFYVIATDYPASETTRSQVAVIQPRRPDNRSQTRIGGTTAGNRYRPKPQVSWRSGASSYQPGTRKWR